MPREKIWEVMNDEYYEIPEKLKRAIYNTYKNTKCRVKTHLENDDWFDVKSGVRQGSVSSPLLVILFLDKCLREKNHGNENIIDLLYADNHAIVAEIEEDLQNDLRNWNTVLGMKISKEKTEIMMLSRMPQEVNISLEGQALQQCTSFKYLGVMFNNKSDPQLEITHRINPLS